MIKPFYKNSVRKKKCEMKTFTFRLSLFVFCLLPIMVYSQMDRSKLKIYGNARENKMRCFDNRNKRKDCSIKREIRMSMRDVKRLEHRQDRIMRREQKMERRRIKMEHGHERKMGNMRSLKRERLGTEKRLLMRR